MWKWRNSDFNHGRIYALIIIVLSLLLILYQIQYKTGIELVPFFPIDQRGFEFVSYSFDFFLKFRLYSKNLLTEVEISEAAAAQPRQGKLFCWVMTTSVFHKTRVPAVNETWMQKCDAAHLLTDTGRFLNEVCKIL